MLDDQPWLILLLVFPCLLGAGVRPADAQQRAARLDAQVRVTLDYLLFLPQGYQEKDSWPLLLFLHGAGERGDDLELVKKHGPPKIVQSKPDDPKIVRRIEAELARKPEVRATPGS